MLGDVPISTSKEARELVRVVAKALDVFDGGDEAEIMAAIDLGFSRAEDVAAKIDDKAVLPIIWRETVGIYITYLIDIKYDTIERIVEADLLNILMDWRPS